MDIKPRQVEIIIDVKDGGVHLSDRFLWEERSSMHSAIHDVATHSTASSSAALDESQITPEAFAQKLTSEMGLGGEFTTKIAHSIRDQLLVDRRRMLEIGFSSNTVVVTADKDTADKDAVAVSNFAGGAPCQSAQRRRLIGAEAPATKNLISPAVSSSNPASASLPTSSPLKTSASASSASTKLQDYRTVFERSIRLGVEVDMWTPELSTVGPAEHAEGYNQSVAALALIAEEDEAYKLQLSWQDQGKGGSRPSRRSRRTRGTTRPDYVGASVDESIGELGADGPKGSIGDCMPTDGLTSSGENIPGGSNAGKSLWTHAAFHLKGAAARAALWKTPLPVPRFVPSTNQRLISTPLSTLSASSLPFSASLVSPVEDAKLAALDERLRNYNLKGMVPQKSVMRSLQLN
jgi:hypothetical protein